MTGYIFKVSKIFVITVFVGIYNIVVNNFQYLHKSVLICCNQLKDPCRYLWPTESSCSAIRTDSTCETSKSSLSFSE